MATINLTPEELETLELLKEEEAEEMKKIYKILLGESYAEDPNVLRFFQVNWHTELEKYFKIKAAGEINYQKKFEKLIDKMDKLIQKHKIEDAY